MEQLESLQKVNRQQRLAEWSRRVAEEYTKIGTFDATEEFVTAVAENPELEGWGNKIILISQP